MKAIKNAVLLVSCLLASTAALSAEPFQITVPADSALKSTDLSRAQVVADLLVWKLSGMDKFDRESSTWQDDDYITTMARYNAIRKSPEFQKLVKQLEEDPNTKVVAR